MSLNIRYHETQDHLVAFTIFQDTVYDLLSLRGPASSPEERDDVRTTTTKLQLMNAISNCYET